MKITLDINDNMMCGIFNGLILTYDSLQMVSYQLDSDDLVDGKTIKLPRKDGEAQ